MTLVRVETQHKKKETRHQTEVKNISQRKHKKEQQQSHCAHGGRGKDEQR